MADTEDIQEAIAQAAVKAAKAMVLVISSEGRRQNIHPKPNCAEATRDRTGYFLRQLVFKCTTKDKYLDIRNFEMEAPNIFLTRHYDINDAEKMFQ